MKQPSGFSLVELSIVLVILGLLTGGILTGQSLIRAAELRKIGRDLSQYKSAIFIFKEKYFALPGDMPNATALWGIANIDAATCKITPSTGTETCNGNGDGAVYPYSAHSNEGFRFWQHLANAGLVNGKYSGVSGPWGDWHPIPGENTPATGIASVSFSVDAQWTHVGHWDFFDGTYGNTFMIGAFQADWEAFTPEEMYNFETKLDDKKPGTGIIRVRKASAMPNCANNDDTVNAEYVLSEKDKTCFFHYIWESF